MSESGWPSREACHKSPQSPSGHHPATRACADLELQLRPRAAGHCPAQYCPRARAARARARCAGGCGSPSLPRACMGAPGQAVPRAAKRGPGPPAAIVGGEGIRARAHPAGAELHPRPDGRGAAPASRRCAHGGHPVLPRAGVRHGIRPDPADPVADVASGHRDRGGGDHRPSAGRPGTRRGVSVRASELCIGEPRGGHFGCIPPQSVEQGCPRREDRADLQSLEPRGGRRFCPGGEARPSKGLSGGR